MESDENNQNDFSLEISNNPNIDNLENSECYTLFGSKKYNCSMSSFIITIPADSIGINKAFYPGKLTTLELESITVLTNTPLRVS